MATPHADRHTAYDVRGFAGHRRAAVMADPTALVVDLFAGPGGWDEGLRIAGWPGRAVGLELCPHACATGQAAGHQRIRTDVARFPLGQMAGRVSGLIASPPCTSFSSAGTGAGRALLDILATATTRIVRGQNPGLVVARARRAARHELRVATLADQAMRKWTRSQRSAWVNGQVATAILVLEPARWIVGVEPEWVALEQVPAVLPLWRHLAVMLREIGYSTWAGVLSAEEYGVAQTRRRAIFMASRTGAVRRPEPTHQAYRAGVEAQTEPDLFGDPLPPPVSMAEALGWVEGEVSYKRTRGSGIIERHGDRPDRPDRPDRAPAPTITSKSRSDTWALAPAGAASRMVQPRPAPAPAHTITGKGTAAWVLRNGNQANACTRDLDEPAGTMFFSKRTNAVDWVQTRPSTTVCGDPRIGRPGHKDREGGEAQFAEASVRVTVAEASVLQSFRADYPWQGSKSQQYQQVGNAVPPLLAAAVVGLLFSDRSAAAA